MRHIRDGIATKWHLMANVLVKSRYEQGIRNQTETSMASILQPCTWQNAWTFLVSGQEIDGARAVRGMQDKPAWEMAFLTKWLRAWAQKSDGVRGLQLKSFCSLGVWLSLCESPPCLTENGKNTRTVLNGGDLKWNEMVHRESSL